MEDYLLTNKVARTQEQANILAKEQYMRTRSAGSRVGRSRAPSAEAYFPVVGVTPEMLNAFYEGVNQEYGSMDQYLTELGVDQAARDVLVSTLME